MTTPHDPNAGAYLLDSIRLAMGNIRERFRAMAAARAQAAQAAAKV